MSVFAERLMMGAAGGGPPAYIEDVFSTWLYNGNSSTQTITNGIDLAGKGGLVVVKNRTTSTGISGGAFGDNVTNFSWQDTTRSITRTLCSNRTNAETSLGGFTDVNSSGFTLQYNGFNDYNHSGNSYASWTFAKQPKFFDIVTYTGDGSANRSIPHSLGSTPGFIVIKRTSGTQFWYCWHRNYTGAGLYLNSDGIFPGDTPGFDASQSSTTINLINGGSALNISGSTYVAYLFAHDAGGFGASGTDNAISCGSFTVSSGTGSTDVNLGYEPQWLLAKPSTDPGFATNWDLYDTMRGWVDTTNAGNVNRRLNPNLSQQETSNSAFQPKATGFSMLNSAVYPGVPITYIYIAIRRGPMRTPTSGTSVFTSVSRSGTLASATVTSVGFPSDWVISKSRTSGLLRWAVWDRLRGVYEFLSFNRTDAGITDYSSLTGLDSNVGYSLGQDGSYQFINSNFQSSVYINHLFRRAPGFFDVVCYTGTGVARTVNHNLGVVPEMMIVKSRSVSGTVWPVYHASQPTDAVLLDSNIAKFSSGAQDYFGNETTTVSPTATVFTVGGGSSSVGTNGTTYVWYGFASCPGVSKVGTYTGNGSSQTINCGFTAGARFIMIKRTDSTGDWYLWDAARGIVAANDPHLSLNSTDAEVTTNDSVDPESSGFIVNQVSATNINVNGATYIYLAIA